MAAPRRAATTHLMDDSNTHHTGFKRCLFSKWQERNLYIYFRLRKNK